MTRWSNGQRAPWRRALRSDPFTPFVFVMSLISLVIALLDGNYLAALAWLIAASLCVNCWLAHMAIVYMEDRHLVRLQVARRFGGNSSSGDLQWSRGGLR